MTVLDRNNRLMNREDDDISEALQDLFQDEGIEIVLKAKLRRVSGRSGQWVTLVIEQGGQEKTLQGSHLLVAAGRAPSTSGSYAAKPSTW